MEYKITTEKGWLETKSDLELTFQKWGVNEWRTSENRKNPVTLTYIKDGHEINLTMGSQSRPVDNLRVLYLAVEAMRLNEKRGIADTVRSAYLQLDAPIMKKDPYEVLNLYRGAPLSVCEAMYKELVKKAHPDAGGSAEKMKELNEAITEIRKGNI